MLTLMDQLKKSPLGLTAAILSQRLDKPLPLIIAMLEHLERSGRIERMVIDNHCATGGGCRHCPDNNSCTAPRYCLRS